MTTLEEKSKRFYGTAGAADYNAPIESFFARQESRHLRKNDMEGLAKARAARGELAKFAAKHGMTTDDVRTALSALNDHETHERSAAAVETRWPRNFEAMAEKYGGPDAARSALARADKFQKEFRDANPYLAARMVATGASSAPEIVEVSAKYGADKTWWHLGI